MGTPIIARLRRTERVSLPATDSSAFCSPRGLGLATATTSATFFPHREQRIRVASAASVTFLPSEPGERFRLDVPRGAARAGDAHEELAETVLKPLDVRQHARLRMVLTPA
jgi:hypothetical protein